MKKRKIIFIKLVILFLGFSVTLFSCEPEILDANISTENQTDSVLEDFQSQFNKKGFEKTIPYDYKVDWSNTTKQYSEELSVNFFEFDLIYNDVFNPHSTNKSNKRKYNIAYKLIVLENQETTSAFYIAKFFQEKEGGIAIENLHPKLNNNFGYKGLTHLYDIEGELVFAKYISKDENDNSEIYIDRKLRQREENIAEKYIEVCDTVRTHRYVDWYYHQYDLEGNLVSVTYSHTTYAGYTDKKNCYTKWVPDNGDGGLYGTGVGCDEFGECVTDIKEALIEEYISNSLTLTDEQSQWFNDWQNRQAKESIENYLKQYVGNSEFENAIQFALTAINILSSPLLNSTYISNYENDLKRMIKHLRDWGNPEDEFFADYLESLLPDLYTMTLGDVIDIHKIAKEQVDLLTLKYLEAIVTPFAEATYPFVVYAVTEATLGAAIPIISKIPISMVVRGIKLQRFIKTTTKLGIQGSNPNIRMIYNQTSTVKAESLFAKLTQNAVKIDPPINTPLGNLIKADMGNGNYIVLRYFSSTNPNAYAVIEYNYLNLLKTNSFEIKFLP